VSARCIGARVFDCTELRRLDKIRRPEGLLEEVLADDRGEMERFTAVVVSDATTLLQMSSIGH
jgi:hypothetical protein